jgi:hypothetical protein
MPDRTTEAFEALLDKKDAEIKQLKLKVEELRNEIHTAANIVQRYSDDNSALRLLKNNLFTTAYQKDDNV